MRRSLSTLVVIGLLVSSGVPSVAADLAYADSARALDFRAQFGLETDPGFIRSVFANPDASLALGTPLLPDEVAEIDRRDRIAKGLEPLTAMLLAAPDYAGLYLDQQASGQVVIRTVGTGATSRHSSASWWRSGTSLSQSQMTSPATLASTVPIR
jgi:hypothetical protein